MTEVKISDKTLQEAASRSIDSFVAAIDNAIRDAIGGELTADTMQTLNADQITLLAYSTLHEEVMDGGFIQLIHNGYGGFIFHNPFAKVMRMWELPDLAKLINKAHTLYKKHGKEIERECSDEEFMALFERYPDFDDCDDAFVENEEMWTEAIGYYIDKNIEKFVKITE